MRTTPSHLRIILANFMKRLLDLFCGAGGATKGYQLAGFHVTGIDNRPQRHYCGDLFIQSDALTPPIDLSSFDVIHASPPCQAYSQCTPKRFRRNHPDLISATRELLEASGKPYVIENVPSARRLLNQPLMLCGSMFFSVKVRRHRYFEIKPAPWMTRAEMDQAIPPAYTEWIGLQLLSQIK